MTDNKPTEVPVQIDAHTVDSQAQIIDVRSDDEKELALFRQGIDEAEAEQQAVFERTIPDDGLALRALVSVADAEKEVLDPLESMTRLGYAKQCPRFMDILGDDTRTNTVNYLEKKDGKLSAKSVTESKGLRNLKGFLDNFLALMSRTNDATGAEAVATQQAVSMMENLSFLGEREFQEATEGIKDLWVSQMRANPDVKIFPVSLISGRRQYTRKTKKSDVFVRDSIWSKFSDDELSEFGDRILTSEDQLDADPGDTHIVVVDDWIVSGSQMRDAVKDLSRNPRTKPYVVAGNVEVHVLMARGTTIENGIASPRIKGAEGQPSRVPVFAYYRAHEANEDVPHGGTKRPDINPQCHITGAHCPVNYGFYDQTNDFVRIMERRGEPMPKPVLSNVEHSYRGKKATVMPVDGKLKRVTNNGRRRRGN